MNQFAQGGSGVMAIKPCPACGREWGQGISCQNCGQVEGLPNGFRTSSVGRRLGAHLLDSFLLFITLFIGWFVWSLVIWSRGQTPGKQILNMRTVKIRDRQTATFGTMFVREIVAKFLIGILAAFTLVGFVLYFWLVWDKNKQELWDKIPDTLIVDDPSGQLNPATIGQRTSQYGGVQLPPPSPTVPAAPPPAPEAPAPPAVGTTTPGQELKHP